MSSTTESDDIEIRVWIKEGGMLVNTGSLDIDHPDHPYNQILAMGKRPEDYGIRHPYEEEFDGKNRTELVEEIIRLRKELEGWAKDDAFGFPGLKR